MKTFSLPRIVSSLLITIGLCVAGLQAQTSIQTSVNDQIKFTDAKQIATQPMFVLSQDLQVKASDTIVVSMNLIAGAGQKIDQTALDTFAKQGYTLATTEQLQLFNKTVTEAGRASITAHLKQIGETINQPIASALVVKSQTSATVAMADTQRK